MSQGPYQPHLYPSQTVSTRRHPAVASWIKLGAFVILTSGPRDGAQRSEPRAVSIHRHRSYQRFQFLPPKDCRRCVPWRDDSHGERHSETRLPHLEALLHSQGQP